MLTAIGNSSVVKVIKHSLSLGTWAIDRGLVAGDGPPSSLEQTQRDFHLSLKQTLPISDRSHQVSSHVRLDGAGSNK